MVEYSNSGDGKKISDLSKEIHTVQKIINECYTLFESLTNEFDEISKTFEQQLQNLDN